jgi:hypothetical protein
VAEVSGQCSERNGEEYTTHDILRVGLQTVDLKTVGLQTLTKIRYAKQNVYTYTFCFSVHCDDGHLGQNMQFKIIG